jgi:hypothetical protein
MATRSYVTTNEALAECLAALDELIGWAEADAQHALENDAPSVAADDRARAKALRAARRIVATCEREG